MAFVLLLLFAIYDHSNSESIICLDDTDCSCDGSTSGESCTLNCPRIICRNQKVTCRDGDPCTINCEDRNSCRQSTITCPTGESCVVNCENHAYACLDANVVTNGAKEYQCTEATSGVCPPTPDPYTSDPTQPTSAPTHMPTRAPTMAPSEASTGTTNPTLSTNAPTTALPTLIPTTASPTAPSPNPTSVPSTSPTLPTMDPTTSMPTTPTIYPSAAPSVSPLHITETAAINPTGDKGTQHDNDDADGSDSANTLGLMSNTNFIIGMIVSFVCLCVLLGVVVFVYMKKKKKQKLEELFGVDEAEEAQQTGSAPIGEVHTNALPQQDTQIHSNERVNTVAEANDVEFVSQSPVHAVVAVPQSVFQCVDCGNDKELNEGKVYDTDGQFYCNECWSQY